MSLDNAPNRKIQYQVPAEQSKKWAWMRRILASKSLSASAKNLATALMMHHNEETGQCNPKQSTLSAELGIGRTYVNQMVAELEGACWIAVQRTRGASLYRLELDHVEAQGSGEMSANDNIRCSQKRTSDVGKREPLDVGNREHRTSNRNLKRERPKGTPISAAPRIQAMSHANGAESEPEFTTINGVRIPTATVAEWEGEFRSIRVGRELMGLTAWLNNQNIPESKHVSKLASILSRKDAEAEFKVKEIRIKAEADAKHAAARARPRPAI